MAALDTVHADINNSDSSDEVMSDERVTVDMEEERAAVIAIVGKCSRKRPVGFLVLSTVFLVLKNSILPCTP
jgi:hypothetical protein